MKTLIPAALLAAMTLLAPLAAQAASTTYNGNGNGGFGGPVGSGKLTVSNDTSGNLTFSLAPSGGTLGNDLVVYIDSVSGGFADTSQFSDNGDGGREAISGYNSGNSSRTLATFSPGFTADYALSFEDGYVSLFGLAAGGNNTLNYITGAGQTAAPYAVTITAAQIGLTSTGKFNFVGSLISTSAYRSNETFGVSATILDPTNPGTTPNAGFTGSQVFAGSLAYNLAPAAAPEPGSLVPFVMGVAALGGMVAYRRRAAAQ